MTTGGRLAHSFTIALQGLHGVVVKVETHMGPGLIGMTVVGLPDTSIKEAKDRVRAALTSSGIPAFGHKTTVNLSPASVPKNGSTYDLAIAVSLLQAANHLPGSISHHTVFAAELGLDGSLRPCTGILPIAQAAKEHGFQQIVVAPESASEAALIDLPVIPCPNLRTLLEVFKTQSDPDSAWEKISDLGQKIEAKIAAQPETKDFTDELDLEQVRGQPLGIRAAMLAAAGGHHVLFYGEPGCGKSMLAARIHTILPELSKEQALTLAMVRSLAGQLERGLCLERLAPVEIVHSHTTTTALVGGGNPIRPGAISLSNHGVLVLDEAPEFQVTTLNALRPPLDTGQVTLHRQAGQATFPAEFLLALTANPCACGAKQVKFGSTLHSKCKCTPYQSSRYRARLTGPLLDRVDLQLKMLQPSSQDLQKSGPKSAVVREQVSEARTRAEYRWKRVVDKPLSNARVIGATLRDYGHLPEGFSTTLETAIERGVLSMRGADKLVKVAWTNADLEGRSQPNQDDVQMAMQMRQNQYGTE